MKKFENYQQAVTAFEQSPGGSWLDYTNRHSQISPDLNQQMSASREYHNRLMAWFDAASELPTPWPQEYMKAIFKKKNGAYPEVFGWCKEQNLFFLESLLGMGANPLLFVQSVYSTLLGFAAYSENHEAVKVLLQHCSSPQSRLMLTKDHVSAEDPMLHSTLLHRLCGRFSSTPNLLKIVDHILEHDPDAILAKTKGGKTPLAVCKSYLKKEMQQRYNDRMAQLQALRIAQEVENPTAAASARRKI